VARVTNVTMGVSLYLVDQHGHLLAAGLPSAYTRSHLIAALSPVTRLPAQGSELSADVLALAVGSFTIICGLVRYLQAVVVVAVA